MSNPPQDPTLEHRLSRIETQWTMVEQAHGATLDGKVPAKESTIRRYHGAVYRYLLGAVRDADVAEELAQEFAIRFLRGDFRRASPEKGRFRKYLKTVLINLVNDHFNSKKAAERQLSPDAPDPVAAPEEVGGEHTLEDCLREDLLNGAWAALEQANKKYHAALLIRVENPDLSSRELAAQLSENLETDIKADWVRKNIERARTKFADLLVEQVGETMECSTTEELEFELETLNLMSYCRSAFEKRQVK